MSARTVSNDLNAMAGAGLANALADVIGQDLRNAKANAEVLRLALKTTLRRPRCDSAQPAEELDTIARDLMEALSSIEHWFAQILKADRRAADAALRIAFADRPEIYAEPESPEEGALLAALVARARKQAAEPKPEASE